MIHPRGVYYHHFFCRTSEAMIHQTITIDILSMATVNQRHYRIPSFFQVFCIRSGQNVFSYCPWEQKCGISRAKCGTVQESPATDYHGKLADYRPSHVLLRLMAQKVVNDRPGKSVVSY